jgi:hypothetical protein
MYSVDRITTARLKVSLDMLIIPLTDTICLDIETNTPPVNWFL